jgi:NADH-quinone oxidoreductase subunit M
MNAWRQRDFKRLIAYSSFAHVNFILAGIFVWSEVAHTGALLQTFNHGITITGLFLTAGWLQERLGSSAISSVRGLAVYMPKLCWLTLFFVLSSVALPGTNNFIGELLILFGIFGIHPWLTAVLTLTVILTILYMLRWMQKVYFEAPSPHQPGWIDIGAPEMLLALPLLILILWIGIYPAPILHEIQPAGALRVAVVTP